MNNKAIITELLTIIIVLVFLMVGLVFGKTLITSIIGSGEFTSTESLDRLNSTNNAIDVLDWMPLFTIILMLIIAIVTIITIQVNPVFAVFGVLFLIVAVLIAGELSSFLSDSFESDPLTNASLQDMPKTKATNDFFAPLIFICGIILLIVMYSKGN